MNPQETDALMKTIRKIRSLGITVVLIEHDMKLVMNICDTITVLNYGQNIAQGTPSQIKRNPLVVEAYLGKEDA
jgi:branched-chain amino acid transport system ATP-binding protein